MNETFRSQRYVSMLLVTVLLVFPVTTKAELVTFKFTGTLGSPFPANFNGSFTFESETQDLTPGVGFGNYQGAIKSMTIMLGSTTFSSSSPVTTRIDVANDVFNSGLGTNDFYVAQVAGGFSGSINNLTLDEFSLVLRGDPLWFSSDSLPTNPGFASAGVDLAAANFFFSGGNVSAGAITSLTPSLQGLMSTIEASSLASGDKTSLTVKLRNSQRSIDSGRLKAARSQLNEFIEEVRELELSGVIDPATADILIGNAEATIRLL